MRMPLPTLSHQHVSRVGSGERWNQEGRGVRSDHCLYATAVGSKTQEKKASLRVSEVETHELKPLPSEACVDGPRGQTSRAVGVAAPGRGATTRSWTPDVPNTGQASVAQAQNKCEGLTLERPREDFGKHSRKEVSVCIETWNEGEMKRDARALTCRPPAPEILSEEGPLTSTAPALLQGLGPASY